MRARLDEVVDETAHVIGGLQDAIKIAQSVFCRICAGVFVAQDARKAVDVPQGRAEVVGDGIAEGFKLLVGGDELVDFAAQVGIQILDLDFDAAALGDVAVAFKDGHGLAVGVRAERPAAGDGDDGAVVALVDAAHRPNCRFLKPAR